ncbi:MAG: methionine--tRNA ligase [Acholeplasmatales bacterium]|nr:methionine--tRNA ligase [Acholeplasmatales bacterium]
MSKKFYLTTAIAYTSSKPHIGNVYEAILADAIVRYKKKDGYDTWFQTGTDEHGQKIEQKALSLGITPKEHVDKVSKELRDVYDSMNVKYDHFIRTTDEYHEKQVAKAFEKLLAKGDIYKGTYEGYYCVNCESYFTEKDLVDGCCPDCGAKINKNQEECYFLKLEPYRERLLNYINENPKFIEPEARKNEMINNFLKNPIPDLCVSRTSYKWGIPVISDPKHVIYVWIDALINYITGLGYDVDGNNQELYKKYWPADCHLIGKDILRFHTIYWPIMLMALDLPLPKQVFGHPWVLMNHQKMSKHTGNVIYADELVEVFGVDAVRYYVLHEIPFAQDGNLTYELVCERSNSDLANTYGNLVSRTIAMVKKYFKDETITKGTSTEFDNELKEAFSEASLKYSKLMDEFRIADALEEAMKALRVANKYIDQTEPWVLAKDESKKDTLKNVLYNLLEAIRIGTILLEPAIPDTANKVYKALGTNNTELKDLAFNLDSNYNVTPTEILFKRLDVKEVMDLVLAKEEAKKKAIEEAKAKEESKEKPEITIDDFEKLDLVVGEILEAKKHPKADKLLVFKINIGTEVRQIVSGIAKFYNPDDLVGKKVIVVKNLKAIKLRGEESHGMLLCGSDEADTYLELVNIDSCKPGDIVR